MKKLSKYTLALLAVLCISSVAYSESLKEEIKADAKSAEAKIEKDLKSAESKVKKEVKSIEDITYEDFEKAIADAKKEGKIVMLEFTGSDWCPPCKYIDKNIIKTDEFLDYAKDNIKRVSVDFDVGRNIKSKSQDQNYRQLAGIFQVSGFPTVILIDPQTNLATDAPILKTKSVVEFTDMIESFKAKSKETASQMQKDKKKD